MRIYDCEAYLPNSGNPYLCGDSFEPADLIRLVDEVDTKAWGAKTAKFGPYESYMQPPYRIQIEALGRWEVGCSIAGWEVPPQS